MFGAVVIWYAAGALIGGMIAGDARLRKRSPAAHDDGFTALLWLALAAAAIIFALWPWVALNLAQNATL